MSGFDCVDHYLEHCFLVLVPKNQVDDVLFFEVFGRKPTIYERQWAPETILRATLTREIWDLISGELRVEFNDTLKIEGKKTGRWSTGQNPVQRLLGKEMLLLAWALDHGDVTQENVDAAIRNWRGLNREERWWMYTMAAASTGRASDRGIGWRAAIRHALCHVPSDDHRSFEALTEKGTLQSRLNELYSGTQVRDKRAEDAHLLRSISGLAIA